MSTNSETYTYELLIDSDNESPYTLILSDVVRVMYVGYDDNGRMWLEVHHKNGFMSRVVKVLAAYEHHQQHTSLRTMPNDVYGK